MAAVIPSFIAANGAVAEGPLPYPGSLPLLQAPMHRPLQELRCMPDGPRMRVGVLREDAKAPEKQDDSLT